MEEDNYSQQELFEQRKYISDLIEEKTEKKKSSLNVVIGSALLSSGIVLGFLFLFGLFEEEEIVLPEPITITETVKEKELVMPRVDSTEVVSIAELATKTIVQVQVGTLSDDGEFLSAGGGSGVVITDDGLIMTNHHVIDNSTEVRVIFEDGRMYEANIIGSDRGAQHFEIADDGARVFSGVFIQELYGPANDVFAIGKAGALPGDIIKELNGNTVRTLDGLITELRKKRAGDEVEILIQREQQEITLVFTLDLRPSDI